MLVGRETEQQRIAALVAGARVRQSGVLVIAGEAGIGKTTLMEDTARASEASSKPGSGSPACISYCCPCWGCSTIFPRSCATPWKWP